jgi:hypothetical protein
MDIDKSLYMKEFLELRETLGSVSNKPAEHILFTNLYNEFLPRTIQTKVKDIVEEIEEKTILIKDNKQVKSDMTLFDGAPVQEDVGKLPKKDNLQDIVEFIPEDVPEDIPEDKDISKDIPEVILEDIKNNAQENNSEIENKSFIENTISESESKSSESNIDLLGGGRQLKKIVINPNYVAADK